MAWYPKGLRKEITKFRKPLNSPRAVILHVAVSEASSLYGYFSGATSGSHFYVRKDGVVEQYVDTRFQAPANGEANASAISIETQGGVTNAQREPWTEAQVFALADIVRWASEVHGIPLRTMASSLKSERGVGWHRLGVDPYRVRGGELWSSAYGKICPGDAKIGQVSRIVALAVGGDTSTESKTDTVVIPQVEKDQDMGALVEALYRIYQGRPASESEIDNWVLTAASADWTAKKLHDNFITSAAEGTAVVAAYKTFLGREPSDADIATWTKPGTTIKNVREGVAGSAEAQARK